MSRPAELVNRRRAAARDSSCGRAARAGAWMRRLALLPVLAVGLAAAEPPGWWRGLDLRDPAGRELAAPPRWLVAVFVDRECPVANASLPVLNGLAVRFGPAGFGFLAVYCDPFAPPEDFARHAADHALAFPAADDRAQRLARLAGATYTPEAVVFDRDGTVLYRGRIDDRVGPGGAARPAAVHHDLREVLERILRGESGPFPGVRGFGCTIPAAPRSP